LVLHHLPLYVTLSTLADCLLPTTPRLFLLPASNDHLQSRLTLFAVAIVPVILPTRLIPSISLSSLFIFITRLIQL